MVRYLPGLLTAALLVFCLIDCLQSPSGAVRSLPKPAWLAVIVLIAGRPDGSAAGPGGRPPGPQGPDDDPDFLRGLGRGPRA